MIRSEIKSKKSIECGCLKYEYVNGKVEYVFCLKHRKEAKKYPEQVMLEFILKTFEKSEKKE